jgi:Uma2 family endonuclease
MGARTLMSVEDFDRLEEPDELSYELDEGELVVMTKPRPLHNRIVANLDFELRAYLRDHPVGEIFNSDNLFVRSPTPSAPRTSRSFARSAPDSSIPTPISPAHRT